MLLEQKITILEKRIKVLEERLEHMGRLEARLNDLTAAHNETQGKMKDAGNLTQDILRLKDAINQVNQKAVAVENKIPALRKEIEKYSRDSNMGILLSIGVFIVLIIAASLIS